jgi:hypothetical protein
MPKHTVATINPARVAVATSRQVWLAGLGAAAVARDWARDDAGQVFRSLVKEGSTVETRVMRALNHRMNSSIAVAQSAFNKARDTGRARMNGLADAAAAAWPRFAPAVVAQRTTAKPASRTGVRKTRRGKRSAARI